MTISFTHTKLIGKVNLPASKSISNRVLLIQALSKSKFKIANLSNAHDTIVLQKAFNKISSTEKIVVINIEDAGTACRFLISYLAMQQHSTFILEGTKRMYQRPISDLVDALRFLGADIHYIHNEGFLPLKIIGKEIIGGSLKINTSISSQFISSMCLIAPLLENGLVIELSDKIVSATYLKMTLDIMSYFNIQSILNGNILQIPKQQYIPKEIVIENDWSSASFFYAMAIMSNEAIIEMPLLQIESLQGDAHIKEIADDFGIETQVYHDSIIISKTVHKKIFDKHFDLQDYPDLAIPLIVACATTYPSITFSGLSHLAYKESDRLFALTTELNKIGIILKYQNDLLTFEQTAQYGDITDVSFHTYHDHRIAMALSMLSIHHIQVTLDDTDCVKKSFPQYWDMLKILSFSIA